MPDLCFHLLCPENVGDKVIDFLLLRPELAVFTSTRTAAHGLAFGPLSANEQVLGHARAREIQVLIPSSGRAALLEAVRLQFAGCGMRYWFTPVADAGEIA